MSRARYEVCQRPGCNGDGVWDWRKGEHFAFGLDDAEETTRHLNETGPDLENPTPWVVQYFDDVILSPGATPRWRTNTTYCKLLVEAAEVADKFARQCPWIKRFRAVRGSIEVALL